MMIPVISRTVVFDYGTNFQWLIIGLSKIVILGEKEAGIGCEADCGRSTIQNSKGEHKGARIKTQEFKSCNTNSSKRKACKSNKKEMFWQVRNW